MWIGRKKPRYTKAQALSARPVRVVEAALVTSDTGVRKISIPINTRGWAGFVFRMPQGATKTFELDDLGVLVWESCDGKTSVQQIIRKLSKQYNLNLREAEVPTLKFLETLVRRGLVGMSVPQAKQPEQD